MKIVVASKNPVKIQAAKEAFANVFPETELEILSMDVDSGVPAQPMSYEQTREGAYNRVMNCYSSEQADENSDLLADYYIAYEGGVDVFEDGPKTFAVVCISNKNDVIYGQTATLPLPLGTYQDLLSGMELGHSMDKLFNTHNIKQKGGAIGQLTAGLETRLSTYKSATVLALSYFAKPELFA